MKTYQKTRSLLLLLAIVAHCVASAQMYISAPRYDSLGTRYDTTLSVVQRCNITSDHCWACFNLGKVEENWKSARELLDLAERTGVDTIMAQAYFQLCDAALGAGDPSGSLQYGYLSRDYSQRAGDVNNAAKAEKELAITYKMLGDNQRALVLLRGAVQRMTTPHQLTRTYAHLSECYLNLGDID